MENLRNKCKECETSFSFSVTEIETRKEERHFGHVEIDVINCPACEIPKTLRVRRYNLEGEFQE